MIIYPSPIPFSKSKISGPIPFFLFLISNNPKAADPTHSLSSLTRPTLFPLHKMTRLIFLLLPLQEQCILRVVARKPRSQLCSSEWIAPKATPARVAFSSRIYDAPISPSPFFCIIQLFTSHSRLQNCPYSIIYLSLWQWDDAMLHLKDHEDKSESSVAPDVRIFWDLDEISYKPHPFPFLGEIFQTWMKGNHDFTPKHLQISPALYIHKP